MKKITILVLFVAATFSVTGQYYLIKPDNLTGKDAEIWSYQTAPTTGDVRESSNIFTWTRDGDLALKRSLIEFDLDSLPSSEYLIEAKLNLYFNPTDQYESFHEHSGMNSFYIERIISEWNENEVFWGNQPISTPVNRILVPASTTSNQNYLQIDALNLVKDMLDDLDNSFGFIMMMQNEIEPYAMCILASSNHPNENLHPSLELTFNVVNSTETQFTDEELTIFPNPLSLTRDGKLYIESSMMLNFRYDIINSLGQVNKSGIIEENKQIIDMTDLAIGSYIVQFQSGKNSCSKKLVIVK